MDYKSKKEKKKKKKKKNSKKDNFFCYLTLFFGLFVDCLNHCGNAILEGEQNAQSVADPGGPIRPRPPFFRTIFYFFGRFCFLFFCCFLYFFVIVFIFCLPPRRSVW